MPENKKDLIDNNDTPLGSLPAHSVTNPHQNSVDCDATSDKPEQFNYLPSVCTSRLPANANDSSVDVRNDLENDDGYNRSGIQRIYRAGGRAPPTRPHDPVNHTQHISNSVHQQQTFEDDELSDGNVSLLMQSTVASRIEAVEDYVTRVDKVYESSLSALRKLCKLEDRPIILVDMDNTLVDWDDQFRRLVQKYHPQIPILDPTERTEFQMELNYSAEHREPILHLTSLADFWLSMRPMEGAIEAVNAMHQLGMIVLIVTTPDSKHTSRSASEKINWVEEHLGLDWKFRCILAHDKTLVRGDILIDDKPTAAQGLLRPNWTHVLFAQPYNAVMASNAHTPAPRLEGWREWPHLLSEVLSRRFHQRRRRVSRSAQPLSERGR